jgi:hypothetical protein
MVDLALIQSISYMAGALGVFLGAVYYILNMRTQTRTREAQLFMQIYDHFREPEFMKTFSDIMDWQWSDYEDFEKKYGRKTNPEAWYNFGSMAGYFEGIGILVQQGLLDPNLVNSLLKAHIIWFWDKIKPISIEMRSRYKLPEMDQWKEYLYTEIKKRN